MRKQYIKLAPAGQVRLEPDFVAAPEADAWLERLRRELDWQQREIVLFGRRVMQPRLVAWHGDPGVRYRYSGTTLRANGWTACLHEICVRVEHRLGVSFNSVLCNLYRDGADGMGWHADDEPELGKIPVIASLSLGEMRRFLLRRRDDHAQKLELWLPHGSLLVMQGDLQRHWQHALPKTKCSAGPRINLTFRQVLRKNQS